MATKSISQLDTAASVSASDLYEVAIPDVQSASGYASKKESGAQIATFFHNAVQNTNLNTTNKTLVGAINEVDEDSVKWTEQNFLGAKNVIPYPYYHGQSYSHNGVDFTVGDDGTITANGRASGNARYFFAYEFNLKNGTYILSDGGVGTANDYLGIVYYLKSAPSTTLYIDLTDKGEIIFTKDDTWDRATIRLWIRNNTEVSYKKYYPMLRPVSVINKEYEAQAESNRTLTLYKCSMSLIANVENSDTASNAYSIGDYMFHYGKFYKVTAAITQGGAITSGTNVTETTLGAELKAALS